MIDVNGKMESYCDCSKKKTVTTTCIHRELVAAHGDGFLGSMTGLEEPQSYLICVDRETLMFSVASNSGSATHHSHKRTIVTKNRGAWHCRSCMKDRYNLIEFV